MSCVSRSNVLAISSRTVWPLNMWTLCWVFIFLSVTTNVLFIHMLCINNRAVND